MTTYIAGLANLAALRHTPMAGWMVGGRVDAAQLFRNGVLNTDYRIFEASKCRPQKYIIPPPALFPKLGGLECEENSGSTPIFSCGGRP